MSFWISLIELSHVVGVTRLVARLTPFACRPWFPMIAGPLAFVATVSMTVPVVPLLVSLVGLQRQRWPALVFWAVVGSSLGGAVLVYLLGHFGMDYVDARLPQLARSRHWHDLVEWTANYGFVTLAAVSATPVAQTPALLLAAVFGMQWAVAAFALVLGKGVKYTIAGALAARAADQLARYYIVGRSDSGLGSGLGGSKGA